MISIKTYVKAESLEQAYELNQKKSARILGGMLWMKMSTAKVQTAIDLSDLGLDTIEESEDEFRIGAMVPLHDLECHKGLDSYTQGALRESLRHIVGIQFRNVATIGGSIFGRYGFSDVLTLFMALESYVELYNGGRVSLAEFSRMKPDNDVLVRVIVKKTPIKISYISMRNTKTDFPTLTCAVAFSAGKRVAVIGARPQKAVLIEADESVMEMDETNPEIIADAFAKQVQGEIIVGSNMRGSAEYRRHLAEVLVKRACLSVMNDTDCGNDDEKRRGIENKEVVSEIDKEGKEN